MDDDEKVNYMLERHAQIQRWVREGFAGVLPNGEIVDRREFPKAIPMQKNALLGVPEPKNQD